MIDQFNVPPSDEEKQEKTGIILGYWDQEQTFTLIHDLEDTVNSIETKCQNLLQELIYFKKYFEDLDTPNYEKCFFQLKKEETKNSKRKSILSGSTPDVSLRKKQIEIQEAEKIFQENFEEKLLKIHQSLSDAVQKIGLQNNGFLFSTEEYLETLNSMVVNQIPGSPPNVREMLAFMKTAKPKTRSDTAIHEVSPLGFGFSKITANELKAYQKLSKLGIRRRRRRRRKRRVRNEKHSKSSDVKKSELSAGPKKIYLKLRNVCLRKSQETVKPDESSSSMKDKSKVKKQLFCRKTLTDSYKQLENLDVRTLCESLAKIVKESNHFKTFTRAQQIPKKLHEKFNLKRPHSVAPLIAENNEITMPKYNFCKKKFLTDFARSGTQLKNQDSDLKVFNCKKSRSRYTKSSPERLAGYRKITTKRYANTQKCLDESRTREAYAVGSRIMVSDCQRTNYVEINENFFENASGDNSRGERCRQFREKWAEVHTAFLNSYRKYNALKNQFKNDGISPSDAELECVENEINEAIDKYRNFWKFFCKFFVVNHRLNSLKIACETKMLTPFTSLSSDYRRNADFFRPTRSMISKETFRHVQDLQEKIRNIPDL